MTGKQRMLNAYRGQWSDRIAIAPEVWNYYPARVLGVDMIEFQREVPFHQALLKTFGHLGCEGWGVVSCWFDNPDVVVESSEKWVDEQTLEVRSRTLTPRGTLTNTVRFSRDDPSWSVQRPIKDLMQDLPAWEYTVFDVDMKTLNTAPAIQAWHEVGEAYLLEMGLGVPFFDTVGSAFDGGLEAAIFAFMEFEDEMERLQQKYIEHMVRKTRALCETTPFESYMLGCSWSCNSLLGPNLWRKWDRPGIKAVCDTLREYGKLMHLHFHGKCLETVEDFAQMGIDCVCPFERPPGGDIAGRDGLELVAKRLDGRVTMNGNVHTVKTLIRGTPADVRHEIGEIMAVFSGNPRVILGTGDQVGRETPEENLMAMVEEGIRLSPEWQGGDKQ